MEGCHDGRKKWRREYQGASEDVSGLWVELVDKFGDATKIAATSTDSPKEVGV
jgi:hypothetical protein